MLYSFDNQVSGSGKVGSFDRGDAVAPGLAVAASNLVALVGQAPAGFAIKRFTGHTGVIDFGVKCAGIIVIHKVEVFLCPALAAELRGAEGN